MIQNSFKLIFIVVLQFISCKTFGQVPQKFSYQAVIRNASNALINNQNIGMRISILQGTALGASVYTERQSTITNANGLATIEIGTGVVLSGVFANINWGSNQHYIKTEIDPTGGTNYTILANTQLLSVPYSLFALNTTKGTLDHAYDFGGTGNGKTIIADSGAVHISGEDGLLISGLLNIGDTIKINGAAPRMYFNPKKCAFRAGYSNIGIWENNNVGNFSFAGGLDNKASGEYATSFGRYNEATGIHSTALGYSNDALGSHSTAFGYLNVASGEHSTVLGVLNTASGYSTSALGMQNVAKGIASTTLGQGNIANGNSSLVIGEYNDTLVASQTSGGTNPLFIIGNGNAANRSNAMVVLGGGKVGIGNITPLTALHLDGGSEASLSSHGYFIIGEITSTNIVMDENEIIARNAGVASPLYLQPHGGNVGIGNVTNPTHILHISGQGRSTNSAWATTSDGRVKKNIQSLPNNSLFKILKLHPVTFEWIDDYKNVNLGLKKLNTGFISQELETVFPEMIEKVNEQFGEQTIKDFRLLNLSDLPVHIVKAIQEQQSIIENQKLEMEELTTQQVKLEKRILELENWMNEKK